MIQRIQSLYLLLAALCAGATWLFPVEVFSFGKPQLHYLTYGLFDQEGVVYEGAALPVPYSILHTVIGVMLVVTIFLFSNRPRQARLVRGAWLTMLVVAVLQFITSNSLNAHLAQQPGLTHHYGPSLFLPVTVILFALLAERAIKKDEALVRSADRLR